MGILDHGLSLIRSGDLPAARDHFEKLLKKHPGNDGVHRFLGKALIDLGEHSRAAVVINQCIEINPDQPLWCFRDYVRSNYKFINIDTKSEYVSESARKILASPETLERVLQLEKNHYPGSIYKGDGIFGRKLMYDAALNGRIKFISPFTGELVFSDKSLTDYCFKFAEHGFTVCFIGGWAHPFLTFQIILEKQRIVLFGRMDTSSSLAAERLDIESFIAPLAKLEKNCRVYSREIQEYISSPSTATVLSNEDLPHLGHAIWNGLGALVPFDTPEIREKVTGISPSCSVIGKAVAESVFSGKETRDILVEAIPDSSVYEKNIFKITVKGNFVHSRVSNGLSRYSIETVSENELSEIRQFGNTFFPVVTIGLRAGTRQWSEQEAGYLKVMESLEDKYPDVGFIVDGMNSVGDDVHHSHLKIDLEKELAIASSLAVGRDNTVCTVGRGVVSSLAWGEVTDLVIAPWGAGMAKYKWINNSKCLVIGSKCVLSEKPDLHIYDDEEYMELAVRDIYMPSGACTNSSFESMDECENLGESKNAYFYQDFNCDADVIVSLSDEYLNSIIADENGTKSAKLKLLS